MNWKAFIAGVGLPTGLTYMILGNLPMAILMWTASIGIFVVMYYEYVGKFKFRGFK